MAQDVVFHIEQGDARLATIAGSELVQVAERLRAAVYSAQAR